MVDYSMAEFSYDDLISEGMLGALPSLPPASVYSLDLPHVRVDLIIDDSHHRAGFNPSPAFQIPVLTTASPHRFQSPAQSGTSTPTRGNRGGRGGAGRGGARGGGFNHSNSPSPYAPDSGRDSPTYGSRGRGRGAGHSGLGAFNARGRGGRGSGTASPRGGGSFHAGPNPLLVPVKFVPATGPGLGTVGGEDEHGLEKAGADVPTSPPPPALPSADAQLADQVGKIALEAHEEQHPDYSIPETAFEPEPATTATMALDELEDARGAADETSTHPGIGMSHTARKQAPAPAVVAEPAPSAAAAEPRAGNNVEEEDEEPPLFEISVARSEVVVDVEFAPPAGLAAHRGNGGESDESDESEDEQIVYSARAVTRSDPVLANPTLPASTTTTTATTSEFTSLPQAASRPPPASARTARVSQPKQPAKKSKKALKRESRAARKAGRAHPRSGNGHLGGRTLADSEDESGSEEDHDDLADGAALFAQMRGGVVNMDDMLDADAAATHEDGQPRMDDSDVEWGSTSPPPVGRGAGVRGRAKKQLQRQQRADQRQAEKLERLIAAGSTREEVELAMALEASRQDAEELAVTEGRAQRAQAAEERLRLEQDYLANLEAADDDEGDDSLAVMAAFANGAVGSLGGSHGRGDDLDRRIAEDEDDSDAWGTSDEDATTGNSSSSETDSGSYDSEEDTADAADRRLAEEEEDVSEEAGSSEELEMEYSLGDADGRSVAPLVLKLPLSPSLTRQQSPASSILCPSIRPIPKTRTTRRFRRRRTRRRKTSPYRALSWPGGRSSFLRWDRAEAGVAKPSANARKSGGEPARARCVKPTTMTTRRAATRPRCLAAGTIPGRTMTKISSPRCRGSFATTLTCSRRPRAAKTLAGPIAKSATSSSRPSRTATLTTLTCMATWTIWTTRWSMRCWPRRRNALWVSVVSSPRGLTRADLPRRSPLTDTARKLAPASKKKKKKNAGKNYGGAFSASLAEQWELDRKSKAQKKAERAAVRAAAREAESRDAYRGGRTAGKKAKAAREAASQSNDAATINKQIRQFIQYEIGMATMSLPPMSKKSRIAVHLLAEAYGLKSRSMGKGNARFPVLERTSRTTVVGVSERKIVAIVGTADGEDEMSMGYGYGGRPRGGGKMSGLWKALESASGKRSSGGAGRSGGGGVGRNSEGAVVGQGVRAPGLFVLSSSLLY